MKKRAAIAALALLVVITLSGCGPRLTSIDIQDKEITMNRGDTITVEVAKTYSGEVTTEQAADAIEKAGFAWASSYESVATVDNGKITAVGAGDAEITVSAKCSQGTISITIKVTVVVPAEKITGLPENLELVINTGEATARLEASVLPGDATDTTLTYQSEDETVATVDENGLVTAISDGETAVVVSCGEIEVLVPITVTTYTARATSSGSRLYSSASSSGGSSGGAGNSGGSTPAPAPTPDPTPVTPPSSTGDGYFVDPG